VLFHGEMMNVSAFKRDLAEFSGFGRMTIIGKTSFPKLNIELETFTNESDSRQRPQTVFMRYHTGMLQASAAELFHIRLTVRATLS
jgi:hypothetical protein